MQAVLRMPNPSISVHDRVHRRAGHIAVTVFERYVFVWGGYVEHVQPAPNVAITSDYHSTDEAWIYDPTLETWTRLLTHGDIPPRQSGTCAVVLEDHLYIFGGYFCTEEGSSLEGNSCQIFRLDLNTLKWEWLHPTGINPLPCDKLVGWAYAGMLYYFGGFGPPPEDMRVFPTKFQHVVDITTVHGWPRGWNNQLVCYDPVANRWLWPKANGITPSPRAAHASCQTGPLVFVFGGRFLNSRMNDLHCLDMGTMTWSGELETDRAARPQGRSWSSLTFVTGATAVLYGGFNQMNAVLNDCWLLDVSNYISPPSYAPPDPTVLTTHPTPQTTLISPAQSNRIPSWRPIKLPYDHGEPRCWHGSALTSEGDLVIHSGVTQPYYQNRLDLRDHAEDILVIRVSPKSLVRICTDAVVSNAARLRAEWVTLPATLQEALWARSGLRGDFWCPTDPVMIHL